MTRLRTRLLVAMLAIVVVTIAISGLFTRRVAHEEMRKLLVTRPRIDTSPLAEAVRGGGDIARAFARMHARGVVVSPDGRIVGRSNDLADATIAAGHERLYIDRAGRHMELRLPPDAIRDGSRLVAWAYVLPAAEASEAREIVALDRRLIMTFAGATLAAILLTLLLSRRITRPIERLNAAVDAMAKGETPSAVEARGKDEIAQLARSFNAMAASVAMQQELRRRMVSDVAHELRTPLTNLRCELEAMQDGLATPDAPRIASLHEEVVHLSRVVDDLQELAIADAGALRLHIEPIDLGDVIERAAAVFRIEARRRKIELTVTANCCEPVEGDPFRLGQIVRNLLTNAFQHTPDGGTIAIASSCSGDHAVVSVADTGSGIPATDLPHVFERFYRVDESRERRSGGAGLGLAIVRQLVELHGGSVRVESSPSGSIFTLELPLHHPFTSRR